MKQINLEVGKRYNVKTYNYGEKAFEGEHLVECKNALLVEKFEKYFVGGDFSIIDLKFTFNLQCIRLSFKRNNIEEINHYIEEVVSHETKNK